MHKAVIVKLKTIRGGKQNNIDVNMSYTFVASTDIFDSWVERWVRAARKQATEGVDVNV